MLEPAVAMLQPVEPILREVGLQMQKWEFPNKLASDIMALLFFLFDFIILSFSTFLGNKVNGAPFTFSKGIDSERGFGKRLLADMQYIFCPLVPKTFEASEIGVSHPIQRSRGWYPPNSGTNA
ncbi:hypothetical protein Tco_1007263, partial [Tanacetum coccineum]